ncbi:MAG: hypothetical protein Kow00107_03230 [Planctomycetota bacterium]
MKAKITVAALVLLMAGSVFAVADNPKTPATDAGYFIRVAREVISSIKQRYRGDSDVNEVSLITAAISALGKWDLNNGGANADTIGKLADEKPETVDELAELLGKNELDLNWEIATDVAMKGVLEALGDRFTHYLTIDEFRQMNAMFEEGLPAGYGFRLEYVPSTGKTIVGHVLYGTPAWYLGIEIGDEVLTFNGTPVSEFAPTELRGLTSPKEPVECSLSLRKPDWSEPLDYTVPYVDGALPLAAGAFLAPDVAYVRTTLYGGDVDKQFRNLVSDMRSKGAKRLIMDIRNNPGGNMMSAIRIASLMYRDPIVFTRLRSFSESFGSEDVVKTTALEENFSDMAFVCLVNGSSASASEMSSGAFQDLKVPIIGTRTWGKGCGQATFALESANWRRMLYMTMSKYYLPSGRSIHHNGVAPDIEVRDGHPRSHERLFAAIQNSPLLRSVARRAVLNDSETVRAALIERSTELDCVNGYSFLSLRAEAKWGVEAKKLLAPAFWNVLALEYLLAKGERPAYNPFDAVIVKALEALPR